VHPTASIGFTLLHQRSSEMRQVLIDAERALNAAKRAKA
jgi:GGDEF domain-containing protein